MAFSQILYIPIYTVADSLSVAATVVSWHGPGHL